MSVLELKHVVEELETDGLHEQSEQMKYYINENAENVDVSAAAFKCEFIFIEWESLKQHIKNRHKIFILWWFNVQL